MNRSFFCFTEDPTYYIKKNQNTEIKCSSMRILYSFTEILVQLMEKSIWCMIKPSSYLVTQRWSIHRTNSFSNSSCFPSCKASNNPIRTSLSRHYSSSPAHTILAKTYRRFKKRQKEISLRMQLKGTQVIPYFIS